MPEEIVESADAQFPGRQRVETPLVRRGEKHIGAHNTAGQAPHIGKDTGGGRLTGKICELTPYIRNAYTARIDR